MPVPQEERSFPLRVSDKISRVRAVLAEAGYAEPRLLRLLETVEWPTIRRRRQDLPLYLWRTREDTPLNTLVRLFLLQEPAAVEVVRRAVAPTDMADWAELGLLRAGQGVVRANVELCAYQDLVAAADWLTEGGRHEVMGVAASSRLLARMTVRRRAGRTLDLGAGCGVQGLLAAAHSGQVVATDCNPRAAQFARFNARLNGLSNIAWLTGDLFDPLRGPAFDLIVCCPPFVISPATDYLHTHSGRPADDISRAIAQAAPAFLREGGYCQILCNWCQLAGQDWRGRLARWFEGTGCDALVLHSHTEDAAAYALGRIGETLPDPARAADRFGEWLAYYERERIEAVTFGLITLRRRASRANWFHCDRFPETQQPCGAAIERRFALRDFLEASRDDRVLLGTRLRRAPDLRWQQQFELGPAGWSPAESRMGTAGGWSYPVEMAPEVIEFLLRCRGDRPLGEHLKELAAATRQDAERLAAAFLGVVRHLVELGWLLPAGVEAEPDEPRENP